MSNGKAEVMFSSVGFFLVLYFSFIFFIVSVFGEELQFLTAENLLGKILHYRIQPSIFFLFFAERESN